MRAIADGSMTGTAAALAGAEIAVEAISAAVISARVLVSILDLPIGARLGAMVDIILRHQSCIGELQKFLELCGRALRCHSLHIELTDIIWIFLIEIADHSNAGISRRS